MILNVKERLILISILPPQEGSYTTLKIVRQLREDLSFSEEEHEKLKFVQDEKGIRWETKEETVKDVEIGKIGKEVICKALKKLDEEGMLKEDSTLPLYILFVGEGEDDGSTATNKDQESE